MARRLYIKLLNQFPAGQSRREQIKETIMKKDYLKPESQLVNLAMATNILGGSIIPGEEGEAGDGELSTGKNRGEWGDVWGK